MADVPFGVLLSGGVDSSTNVALMSELMDRPVNTFSVAFADHEQYNELGYARRIAEQFGTDHHEVTIDESDLEDFLPDLIHHQDEPIADWVCVPLYYVAKLAKDSGTTVVQVGEGSDELFHGYSHYVDFAERGLGQLERLRRMPRAVLRGALAAASPLAHRSGRGFAKVELLERAALGRYPTGAARSLGAGGPGAARRRPPGHMTPGGRRAALGRGGARAAGDRPEAADDLPRAQAAARRAAADARRQDDDGLLRRGAGSVPRPRPRRVRLGAARAVKVRDGVGKWILKEAVDGLLPRDVVYRKKQGFGAPVGEWFRGDLGDRSQRQIRNSSLAELGLIDFDYVDRSGRRTAAGAATGASSSGTSSTSPPGTTTGSPGGSSGRAVVGALGDNLWKFREAGPLRGSAKAARLAGRRARAELRARRLERRPLAASRPRSGRRSAGRTPSQFSAAACSTRFPTSPPSSARRRDGRGRGVPAPRARRAADAPRVRPARLGPGRPRPRDRLEPRLQVGADLAAGPRLPIPVTYDDDSDIKVPWELSRSQHLPMLAAAHRLTGEERYLDEIGAQLDSWIAANPVEFGPNWACTMDVAIRAANWVAALALCAEAAAGRPWVGPRARLAAPARALHPRPPRGRRGPRQPLPLRRRRAARDRRSLRRGRRRPGVAGVGGRRARGGDGPPGPCRRRRPRGVDPLPPARRRAVPVGGGVVPRSFPGRPSAAFDERLGAMLDFAADYTRADGLAPQIGDADDGRFLPLGDYGAVDHRDHSHLFAAGRRAGTGGGASAYAGRRLLRAARRRPPRRRALRRHRHARARRPRPQRPALLRALRPRPAARRRSRRLPLHGRSRRRGTGSARRPSTRRWSSTASSRTRSTRPSSSRFPTGPGPSCCRSTRARSALSTTATRCCRSPRSTSVSCCSMAPRGR